MNEDLIEIIKSVFNESVTIDVRDLKKQVNDIDDSIEDLRKYRDNCPRGSSRRADFASSINRLRDWQKRLQKKIDRAVDATSTKKKIKENIIVTEGGLGGHLMHLYDNWDLTFADLIDVFASAEQGKLESVTEKVDGQNIFVSWDMQTSQLKAARNKGNIKTGGLNAQELAQKFAARGTVYNAFVEGFDVISRAVSALSPDEKLQVFGDNADVWYSTEIMFTSNPNVINYDRNNIVFHLAGSSRYDKTTGSPTDDDITRGYELLVSAVDKMNSAVNDPNWRVNGPPIRQLKAITSGEHAKNAISRLRSQMSEIGVADSDTLSTYIYKRLLAIVSPQLEPSDEQYKSDVVMRIMNSSVAPTVAKLKSKIPELAQQVTKFVTDRSSLLGAAIAPIEDVVHDFAVDILKDMNSAFIMNHDEEVKRIRSDVQTAIEAIESSSNEDAMNILNMQLRKLRSVENITSPTEGIVFTYKGNTYKFTGNFAPVNQILGLFKYGRSGIPAIKNVNEQMDAIKLFKEALNEASNVNNKHVLQFPPQANVWINWNKNNPESFEPKTAGVGPGEDRLAWEFGAEVQGGSVSYDLVLNGTKIEVKAPDGEKTIRPGTKGLRAISDIKYELDSALRQLKVAMKKYREIQDTLEISHEDKEALEDVMAFVVNDVDGILGGEMGKDKIMRDQKAIKQHKSLALWDVLHIIHDIMNDNPAPMSTRDIEIGGKKRSVDMGTYARLAAQLGIDEKEADLSQHDVLRGLLTHKAFTNPKEFMRDFFVAIDPNIVFAGTDGMFLVNSKQYMYIPANEYTSVLKFIRITQGKPKFKVVV